MADQARVGASGEAVRRALRRMRRENFVIEDGAAGCRLALSMRTSEAGRRNAAEHILDWLTSAGLRIDASDPVAELAGGAAVPVSLAESGD